MVGCNGAPDKAVTDAIVPPWAIVDAGVTKLAVELVATWLKKEFIVESGVIVATSVVPPARDIVGDGIDMVLSERAIGPKDADVKALVAFCMTKVRSVLTVGRDKAALVPVPNTSPAAVFSVGLTATRGSKVLNSLGSTCTAVGNVLIVDCAASATFSRSRLFPCLIQRTRCRWSTCRRCTG